MVAAVGSMVKDFKIDKFLGKGRYAARLHSALASGAPRARVLAWATVSDRCRLTWPDGKHAWRADFCRNAPHRARARSRRLAATVPSTRCSDRATVCRMP